MGGKSQHTDIKKQCLSCTWDHLFYFNFKWTEEQFNTENIEISIFDANTIRRDELIGKYIFQCAMVNGQPDHEYWRQWIGLVNTDCEGTQGFLKISVTVLKPGEIGGSHENDDDDDDAEGADLQSLILLPPDIEKQDYYLYVRCYRAEHLPKMDRCT